MEHRHRHDCNAQFSKVVNIITSKNTIPTLSFLIAITMLLAMNSKDKASWSNRIDLGSRTVVVECPPDIMLFVGPIGFVQALFHSSGNFGPASKSAPLKISVVSIFALNSSPVHLLFNNIKLMIKTR